MEKRKRYNIEMVKIEFENRGYELQENEYKHSKFKMEYICLKHKDEGSQFINLNNLLNDHGCKYCGIESRMKLHKLNPLLVKEKFESLGYKLLDNYEMYFKKMKFICMQHQEQGIQHASYGNLLINKNNNVCLPCSIEQKGGFKLNIEHIKREFEKVGYDCLEDEYINNKYPMKYTCNNHPNIIQTLKWNGFVTGNRCPLCRNEEQAKSQTLSYDFVRNAFEEKGYILLENEYTSSKTLMSYICLKHEDKGVQQTNYSTIQKGSGCRCCGYEKISGGNSYLWKGGITELNLFLRTKTMTWRMDSLKAYNFKCFVTGSKKDLEVHHLYNFSDISIEILDSLNLPIYENISNYSDEELIKMTNKCIELHHKYGLGIPLTKDIHKEFHMKYGYKNNTPEQFEEFKQSKLIECQSKEKGAAS